MAVGDCQNPNGFIPDVVGDIVTQFQASRGEATVEISKHIFQRLCRCSAGFHRFHPAADFVLPGCPDFRGEFLVVIRKLQEDSRQRHPLIRRQFQRVFCEFRNRFHFNELMLRRTRSELKSELGWRREEKTEIGPEWGATAMQNEK